MGRELDDNNKFKGYSAYVNNEPEAKKISFTAKMQHKLLEKNAKIIVKGKKKESDEAPLKVTIVFPKSRKDTLAGFTVPNDWSFDEGSKRSVVIELTDKETIESALTGKGI